MFFLTKNVLQLLVLYILMCIFYIQIDLGY